VAVAASFRACTALPAEAGPRRQVSLRVFGAVEANRVQAFLVVRRLALEMPFPFIEGCFKGLYLTYVRHCKFTNANVAPGQAFMAQCVVELFGLDLKARAVPSLAFPMPRSLL
jgi:hypothetical protein